MKKTVFFTTIYQINCKYINFQLISNPEKPLFANITAITNQLKFTFLQNIWPIASKIAKCCDIVFIWGIKRAKAQKSSKQK